MDEADVVSNLVGQVNNSLEGSSFFSAFASGTLDIEHIRQTFSQYYWWRNRFHRWFGVCIAKSPAFGNTETDFILSELIEHIEEEIKGNHHGLCLRFLETIEISDPAAIEPLPETVRYSDHFISRYMDHGVSGQEALAALAGRELVAPARNRLTIAAFQTHYGVQSGLEFFDLHEELEVEHFRGLWAAVTQSSPQDPTKLLDAARSEIVAHVKFWDDVSAHVGEVMRTRVA